MKKAVAILAALILGGDHQAGGEVGDAHGGVGGVDVLTAGTAGTVGVYLEAGHVDLHFHILRFGQYRHGDGRCVNTSAAFCFGHTLYTVNTAFKFEL